MRSILLFRVNKSITGIGIGTYVACLDRNRVSPSRYDGVTRCVTASNLRRRFIPLIYVSAFDSRACLRAARKIASGASHIFNPLAFTGDLYELRTLNAVILIGSRARYFSPSDFTQRFLPGFIN